MKTEDRVKLAGVLAGMETFEQLNEVSALVSQRWSDIQTEARYAFKVGDRVSFQSKQGGTVYAIVEKLNRKTVSVKQENGWNSWHVSPTMLVKA